MTLKLILAFFLSFSAALIVGRYYIPWLRKMKAGQEIKEIGPSWHMSKAGTPTMGGFIFIAGIILACLTVGFEGMLNGDFTHIFVLLFALVFGAIGFLDDWEKLRKKQNLGLSAKAKFLLQLAAALVFVILMRKLGYIRTRLYIPFFNLDVNIPEPLYFILAAFIIGKRSCLTGWITSVIICAALYLPCMLTTLEQMRRVSGYFTMPDISVHTVIQCLKQPFITQNSILSAVLLALFSLTLVLGILRKNISGLLFISVYPLTLFFGCLATVLLKSNIFTDRYLVPSLGLLWLGFAVIMADIFTLAPAPLYGAVAAVILLCTLKTYSVRLVDEYKSGVEDMIAYFNENICADDAYIIYEDNYQIEICFRYYFPDFTKTKWNKAQSVTGSLYYLGVPGFEDDMKKITENGYSSLYLGDFSFDRYSFKLYRLTPEE